MDNRYRRYQWIVFLGCVTLCCCVPDKEYGIPELECASGEEVNIGFAELIARYPGQTLKILDDITTEGYVISSDRDGNFYGILHVQDLPENPRAGIQIKTDLRDSHLFFPVGSRVLIKLKGLYLGKSKGMFLLGSVNNIFGNLTVGRIPAPAVKQHLFRACKPDSKLHPFTTFLAELSDTLLSTLIKIPDLQFKESELGLPFAPREEEIQRALTNCDGAEISLRTSGYSDFSQNQLPAGNGNITGVLYKDGKDFELVIRDTSDLDMNQPRCPDGGLVQTSQKLIISEIADPDNDANARFIELYYSGEDELLLNNWTVRRYTNANTEVGAILKLDGFRMAPNSFLLIAANSAVFQGVYGFPPDLEGGRNGPADSNGDDNLELVDPYGLVVDTFGKIGEDGSGTNHEFEDGGAFRKSSVITASREFVFSEWEIYNDSGLSGTINLPRNAPDHFSPGRR